MKIGIFTKLEMAGGSEFRAVELATAIAKHTQHEAYLLPEHDKLPDKLKPRIHPNVKIMPVFGHTPNPDILYDMDRIIIINTDSKNFTTIEYWNGQSGRHNIPVHLDKIKSMTFLFNFIISPSQHLHGINSHVKDIRIITTNTKFFNEISKQDRYENIRHYPRTILESPIDPETITVDKLPATKIRLGMHSKGLSDKWNAEFPDLIRWSMTNYNNVAWRFMGMNKDVAANVTGMRGVEVFPEFLMPVKQFLAEVDIFVFFLGWKREEPWSRSSAEALTAGCPVITTNTGGNKDQIVHGNNGYLCESYDDFCKYIGKLVSNAGLLSAMRANAIIRSKLFSSQAIVRKLCDFLE